MEAKNSQQTFDFIEFVINNNNETQYFGIPISKVREIIQTPKSVTIPKMDSVINNMIDLRGQVVNLFNFAQWINISTDKP